MKTPILFLIFNRPDLTKIVFEKIREQQPQFLYIAADGPRVDKEGEKELCEQTRSIINDIDWDCELKTLFRVENLGCKKAVSQAISWFFDNIEEGIILEDDCLPSDSFFNYCENLLEKYRYDTRIMHISGENSLDEKVGEASYYFAQIPHIWGWATWKRAWELYDPEMTSLSKYIEQGVIKNNFDKEIEQKYWQEKFLATAQGKINTWDYQWTYAILSNNGICVNSNNNLIKNIGARDDATHTFEENFLYNRDLETMNELLHPEFIIKNREACKKILKYRFQIAEPPRLSLKKRIIREVLRPFKGKK